MRAVIKYYRVDRREISFLKFIVEAYEGVALVRTVDPGNGLIALHIAPGCESDVDVILKDLGRNILIETETLSVQEEFR